MVLSTSFLALLLVLSLGLAPETQAESDLLSDFFVPNFVNASELDGNFFTFTGFRNAFPGEPVNSRGFTLRVAFATHFPALTGLGVSFATLEMQPQEIFPLHFHSRGSEVIFIMEGQLEVGFVDSTNKLFSQVLKPGDLFAIPESMVHYYFNVDEDNVMRAVATLGSSEPGYTQLPKNLFGSGVSDVVLQNSFGASAMTINSLKAPHEVSTVASQM